MMVRISNPVGFGDAVALAENVERAEAAQRRDEARGSGTTCSSPRL